VVVIHAEDTETTVAVETVEVEEDINIFSLYSKKGVNEN
jgi:hypothetical protein